MVPETDGTNSTENLPFLLNRLTEGLVKKAAEELHEGEDAPEKIKELRQLVEARENFEIPLDDDFLIQFLRARKFDVHRAFATVNNFYHQNAVNRDLFMKFDPIAMRQFTHEGIMYCLPLRAPDGGIVLFAKHSRWKPSKMDIVDVINVWTKAIWHCLNDPATQVAGVHVFVDAKGLNFSHVRCLKPKYMYMFGQWMRVHFHGSNLESLHKQLPKYLLPEEYGGDIPDCMPDTEYLESIEKFHDRYVQIVQAPGETKQK